MRRLPYVLLVLAACGGDDAPTLTDATSLTCPEAGDLPFRLASTGFKVSTTATLAADNPRNKDEASDTLGNPGGVSASVYLPDADAPAAAIDYTGVKARSAPDGGLLSRGLAGETVSLWFYDTGAKAWQTKGSATTSAVGKYTIAGNGFVAPNGEPVYAMLEADGTCAKHYNYLYPAETKVVVADIDGTLTLDDQQIIDQETMASYTPKPMTAAAALTKAWADKGYRVIYLTARAHNLRGDSRVWLEDQGFAPGAMITTNSTAPSNDVYKTLWLQRMTTAFHWSIVAAYGNADTDITAYSNAGIPKTQTFIVGPLAGQNGTQPIANMDFTAHISSYVAAQPSANP